MKTIKFMCAALVAAMTLAGCQKEQEQLPEDKGLASVVIKLNNVAPGTKAIGGLDYDLEGKNIQLNSIQFFFSDGTTLYEAKDISQNTADVYFDADDLAAMGGEIKASFHFLPASVKKVIVLGNYTEKAASKETDLDATIAIVDYQDVENFPLYAEAPLTSFTTETHEVDGSVADYKLYKVNLDIYPLVSRFEITGIGCTLPTGSTKILKVNKMAFADFFDRCDLRTGNGDILRSVVLEEEPIFNYFQKQMLTSKWNNDFFNEAAGETKEGNSHPVLDLSVINPYVETDIAYNFFCKGAQPPTLLFDITSFQNETEMGELNGAPAYLYTKTYKLNSGDPVTTFEPGKIYRMDIRFAEDDLTHQAICLDITLNVVKWTVNIVTPEF